MPENFKLGVLCPHMDGYIFLYSVLKKYLTNPFTQPSSSQLVEVKPLIELLLISRLLCVTCIQIKMPTRKRYDIIKVSKKQEINLTDLGDVGWKHVKKALPCKSINDW